jgi:hypothetical protein
MIINSFDGWVNDGVSSKKDCANNSSFLSLYTTKKFLLSFFSKNFKVRAHLPCFQEPGKIIRSSPLNLP